MKNIDNVAFINKDVINKLLTAKNQAEENIFMML
jgi:hypothetical protein